jgi:predicted DCC family thiol-disulfide oxidoreductase YuxK
MNTPHSRPDRPAAGPEGYCVVLFDGQCGLCQAAVHIIIGRDRRERFRFASLQSTVAHRLLQRHGVCDVPRDTLVLIEGPRVYYRSTAALRIARRLSWPWPLVFALSIIPRFVRDLVYNLVAHNRYSWRGRSAACQLPSAELRARLLDHEPPP